MRISLRGAQQLHRAAQDLRRAGGSVRKETTRAMREAANPTLRKVRTKAATMRISGFRTGRPDRFEAHLPGGHIRQKVSRLVELEISTSAANPTARFVVRNDRLRKEDRNMPFLLDSGKIFRHPIPPNNRHRWAGSRGEEFFYEPIKEAMPTFEDKISDALDRVVDIAEGKA